MLSTYHLPHFPAVLLALCLTCATAAAYSEQQRLVVAADVWCPYNCEPGSAQPGYLVDILKAVFSPLGVSVEYRVMPWKRALASAEQGLIDGVLGAVSGNHGRNLVGREHFGVDETVLLVRKGEEFAYDGPASLDNRSIGVIADYTYDNHGPLDAYLTARAQQARDAYVIHQDNPLQSLFAMLKQSRIDVFPENRYVAQYAMNTLGYREQVSVIDTNVGDTIFIAFSPSPKGRKHLEILDAGVRQLRKSGRLSEILFRYGIPAKP